MLAEFPEYSHFLSRAEITRTFFGQVARYFLNVSYGKLSTIGNATEWITLPRLYQQYVGPSGQIDLPQVAADSFQASSTSLNFTAFDDVFLILSFYTGATSDYVALPNRIVTKTGSISAFAVLEEDRDWTAYARGYALLLGLWHLSSQLQGLGRFDSASGGQGDLSAWSKMNLGWLNSSQIQAYASPPIGRAIAIDAMEVNNSNTHALQIGLGPIEGVYLIEARLPIGYDENSLPDYGLLIVYGAPNDSILQIKAVLKPDNVGKAIFSDPNSDLAIIALNQTKTRFWLLVGSLQDGRDAQRALYSISQADDAIQSAQIENRIEGLDLAEQLDSQAHALFVQGRFRDSEPLALSAVTTASVAKVPADYSTSLQLITQAETLKSQTLGLLSSQGTALVAQADAQLDLAKQNFVGRNFTLAKQTAQTAVDLYNRAEQIEVTQRILGWLSDVALVIPVVVLAYALRYQLKR